MSYIPIDKCKHGHLYLILARNAHIGIYKEENKAFTISRIKFTSNFLFDEYHYDTGAPFGTVKPLKELGPVPVFKDDKEKLDWLNKKTEELHIEERIKTWYDNKSIRDKYGDISLYPMENQ